MEVKKQHLILIVFLLISSMCFSQGLLDDLEAIQDTVEKKREFVTATFKSSRTINGHSIKSPAKREFIFIIGHRFGRLNGGVKELFGLDQASIRFGLEYGINDIFSVGFGRSTFEKNYDLFTKVKLLRQSNDKRVIPMGITLVSTMNIRSSPWPDPDLDYSKSSRLSYAFQLLVARKFNDYFSLQLVPTLLHRNLVPDRVENSDVFSIGVGTRVKMSKRFAVTSEYFYYVAPPSEDYFRHSISVGLDLETGGHVFQLHFTNSLALFEKGYITQTNGRWKDGDIHFGFNDLVQYIEAGTLLGSIKHEGDFSPMPQNGNKLSICSITKIETWITNGYPQN